MHALKNPAVVAVAVSGRNDGVAVVVVVEKLLVDVDVRYFHLSVHDDDVDDVRGRWWSCVHVSWIPPPLVSESMMESSYQLVGSRRPCQMHYYGNALKSKAKAAWQESKWSACWCLYSLR